MNYTPGPMTPRAYLLILLILFTIPALAAKVECPICGMNFEEGARTSYAGKRGDKPVQFCSFSCAHKFHGHNPKAALEARDFDGGKAVDAGSAWFLIKSKNVLRELPFDMPPTVVAFSSEAAAKKTRERLKDGEVVKGFETVEKAYAK